MYKLQLENNLKCIPIKLAVMCKLHSFVTRFVSIKLNFEKKKFLLQTARVRDYLNILCMLHSKYQCAQLEYPEIIGFNLITHFLIFNLITHFPNFKAHSSFK